MNVKQMKDWIGSGAWDSLESAWLDAIGTEISPSNLAEMTMVLEALVSASKEERAQTLAEMLFEETRGRIEPAADLEMLKDLLLAVPASDTLRSAVADQYKKVHGEHAHFAAIFEAAGLLAGQSPRRAIRTLDVCLSVKPGVFLANRYEGQVVKMGEFDPIMLQFETIEADGSKRQLDPKALADLYEAVDPRDFRVLCQHNPREVAQRLKDDPAGVLVGICMSRGGQIDSNDLKEFLVPRFMDAGSWSGWWGKARTAAKRCDQLSLEGRNPIVVSYHAQGRTLEDEMGPALTAAKTPLDYHVLLGQYLRETRTRKSSPNEEFVQRILGSLADAAANYLSRRPADAFMAALALESAAAAGMRPPKPHPSSSEIMLLTPQPEEVVLSMPEPALWPQALNALEHRDDAVEKMGLLLQLSPSSHLDEIAARLLAQGAQEVLAGAVGAAIAQPAKHLDMFLWLWKGPAQAPKDAPAKVELLGRLLKAVAEIEREWDVEPVQRKEIYQKVRAALAASDFKAFKEAVAQMDEHVAATIKRQLERVDALAESVSEACMTILRESFPQLFFVRQKIDPWQDDSVIWTTEAALQRREAEYKDLTEVKMLQNARAIGEAAEHGDLSENSEWKFALEERDMLQARSAKMQEELSRAKVIHRADIPTDRAGIGSVIRMRRIQDGKMMELTFLGPWDIDLANNVYSYLTRLAQEVLGKTIGDEVDMKIEGAEGLYRIEEIALPQ